MTPPSLLDFLKSPKKKKKDKEKNDLSLVTLPATLPSMPSPTRKLFIKGRDTLDQK